MAVQKTICKDLCSYLRSLNFHFLETWVIECVNFYNSRDPKISFETLKSEIKQQWLLLNLRDIKVPSLPPNLISCDKTVLRGTYAVQVETMIDSSKSCYSQLQSLRNVCIENVDSSPKKEVKISSKRCLTFSISDGVQELQAMEYQPISKIRTNDPALLPGFKMLIIGPVECRKGMILLKNENVQLCGGEVDTLSTSNSLKSILIKKLNLNEDDLTEDELQKVFEINKPLTDSGEKENVPVVTCEPNKLVNSANENVETLLSQNDDLFLNLPLETEFFEENLSHRKDISKKISTAITDSNYVSETDVKHLTRDNIFDDIFSLLNKKHSLPDEDNNAPNRKKISLDPELVNEESMLPKNDTSIKNLFMSTETDEIIIPDEDWEFRLPNTDLNNQNAIKSVPTSLSVKSDLSVNFTLETLDNFQEAHPSIPAEMKPVIVSDKPFVYLKDILSLNIKMSHVFTIKAIILTLTKKITVENDEYNLKANITDGSFSVETSFSSKILEDFLGFSPCEMTAMMRAKQTNSAIAQRIKEAFSKTQQKLISLNCLMDVMFYADGRSPLILSIKEIQKEDLNALRERHEKFLKGF